MKKFRCALFVLILCASILFILYENADTYMWGDEVITYSMANSESGGWMLSRGRVGAFLKDEILGNSWTQTGENLWNFAIDLLQNRSSSKFFLTPKQIESGWVTRNDAISWFAVGEEDRFQYGNVYLNAMSDNANSFLYYSLVHTVGSLFMQISATKWSAFIVNLICYLAGMMLIDSVNMAITRNRKIGFVTNLLWSISVGCGSLVTTLRPYMLVMVFQTALLYIHFLLYDAVTKEEKEKGSLYIRLIVPVYVLGYLAHYTTAILAIVLGCYSLAALYRQKRIKQWGTHYVATGAISIMLGILLDPISVLGLLTKFASTNKPVTVILTDAWNYIVENMFLYPWVGLIAIGILVGNIIWTRKHIEMTKISALTGISAVYCILLAILTKNPYFRGFLPMLFLVIVSNGFCFAAVLGKKYHFGRRRAAIVILLLAVILYGWKSVGTVFAQIKMDGYDRLMVTEKLHEKPADTLILVRNQDDAYEYFNVACEMEQTLFITYPQRTIEDYLEEIPFETEKNGYILITNGQSTAQEWEKRLKESHETLHLNTEYEGGNTVLLRWE